MRRYSRLPLAALIIGVLVTGCAFTQYGKMRVAEKADLVTVQSLQKNWQEYELYYAGLDPGNPSAVLFDRKDDERSLTSGRWFKVNSKEMLDDLIDSIQRQLPIGIYYPRLWKVFGPDGHLYGYMFTSWDNAVMKSVDEKTLFVYDLPMPPYLAVGGRGIGFRTPD